jgi:deazaflavin-dependent oxidoreductase (nitroreductase family)
MSAQDHPNNAPGVPMKFPPAVERLQIKYINPLIRPLARYLPTFAVVKHRGRTSGKEYETVVNAFRKGNVLAIALAHGKTNWVKNVLAAGEADVQLFRRDVHITNPRVLPAGSDDPTLSQYARRAARGMGVFVAEIT